MIMKQYYQAQKYLVKILEQQYGLKNKDALFAAKSAKMENQYFPELSILPSEELNVWADEIYNKFVKNTIPEYENIKIELLYLLNIEHGLTYEQAEKALEEYSLYKKFQVFPETITLISKNELCKIICMVTKVINIYEGP